MATASAIDTEGHVVACWRFSFDNLPGGCIMMNGLRGAAVLAVSLAVSGVPASAAASVTEVFDGESFDHLIGAIHEHSGYSDGYRNTRPADYFAAGKEAGLDFVGSGEHSDNADLPFTFSESCLNPDIADCALADDEEPANSFRKWDATREQAEAATDETFTAFRGFEWTNDRHGHLNVYFSQHDANAKTDGGHVTMETFWRWFTTSPGLGGGADGLGTFNHPGREDDLHDAAGDPGFVWDDFEYRPEADDRMIGIEVFNRGRDYGSSRDTDLHPEGWYAYALGKGWHLGAVAAEDGHDPEWAKPGTGRTILIARDHSPEALYEAMLARRMYAVGPDPDGAGVHDIRIAMDADGEPMGSRLSGPSGSTVEISAAIVEGSGAVETLELVTNGGVLAATSTGSSVSFTATITPEERWYFLRARDVNGRPIAYSSPIWIRETPHPAVGAWLAGDLHVHTKYSHDVWDPIDDDNTDPTGDPGDVIVLGHTVERQFAIAASRHLDYLAITDHNRILAWDDPGFGAFDVIPIRGYEKSLRGHAQMLGATRLYSKTGGPPQPDDQSAIDKSREAVADVVDQLHADGGVFQVNHPTGGVVDWPRDSDWGYFECDTGEECDLAERYANDFVPDAIEVWNIQALWQPPFPSSNSIDDAIRYWEGWLDRSERVTATGGSDNHWASTTAVQGVGQPTTWVFAAGRGERAILEGIRNGRTTISWQPPGHGGPRLFLEADVGGDGAFEAMVGDQVPMFGTQFRIRVENPPPGSFVRLITSRGERLREPAVADPLASLEAVLGPSDFEDGTGRWVRADLIIPDFPEARVMVCDDPFGDQTTYCRNRIALLAMTSVIYVE